LFGSSRWCSNPPRIRRKLTARALEPEQRRKNKKQGMHKPSTNKKKLTARALEPEQPRENQKLSFMFIFIFCSNAQPARYARSGPSQFTSASRRGTAAGMTRAECSESLSAAENRYQRRVPFQ